MIETGTVIHGTLREEDLIPAFLGVVEREAPKEYDRIHREYKDAIVALERPYWSRVQSEWEAFPWLLEDLFDTLNDIAPEGMYFGSTEGDGSDFGFWAVEEDF